MPRPTPPATTSIAASIIASCQPSGASGWAMNSRKLPPNPPAAASHRSPVVATKK
jgi:hypothetical protein